MQREINLLPSHLSSRLSLSCACALLRGLAELCRATRDGNSRESCSGCEGTGSPASGSAPALATCASSQQYHAPSPLVLAVFLNRLNEIVLKRTVAVLEADFGQGLCARHRIPLIPVQIYLL